MIFDVPRRGADTEQRGARAATGVGDTDIAAANLAGPGAPEAGADAATNPPAAEAGPLDCPRFDDALAAHEVEIYRFLRRLSPTAEDAADLHQETFLRAFRAWDRLEGSANVRAWLYRIAGNLARDAHRRRSVRIAHGESGGAVGGTRGTGEMAAPFEASTTAADPHARAEASLLVDAVRVGLLALTARQRLAVVGRVLEDRDYADVAASIGCSEATARQHVSQGLARLRRLLRDWTEVTE